MLTAAILIALLAAAAAAAHAAGPRPAMIPVRAASRSARRR